MFERFKQRSYQLERLDTGDYTTAEYARWQKEMRFVHRIFGEMRALKSSLFREIEAHEKIGISVLDVGAGSGELLRELAKWMSAQMPLLVGAEINAEAARTIHGQSISAIRCDALKLPFGDNSFDHVFCSLLLHHLGDEAAIELVREMARVSRGRIFVIDLDRDPVAYYLYKSIGRIFLQRFSVEDGALSILRSYTPDELHRVGERAGLHDIRLQTSHVNRLILSGLGSDYD